MKLGKMTRQPMVLLAAALLVWLAGEIFLYWGWPRDLFRLEEQSGGLEALQEFTLSGGLKNVFVEQSFLLQNGTITSRIYWPESLKDVDDLEEAISSEQNQALPEEDRAQAEADAAVNAHQESSGGLFSTTQRGQDILVFVHRVERMMKWEIGCAPNTRYLCLDLGPMESEEEICLYGYWLEDGTSRDYGAAYSGDYGAAYSVIDGFPTVYNLELGDSCYFAMQDPLEPANNGLWRIEETLSGEELATLPKTATMGGVPVVPGSTAYGRAAMIWSAPEGSEILDAAPVGESICLLLQDGESETTLLVLDADGALCDRAALGPLLLPAAEEDTPELALHGSIALRSDEISVICGKPDEENTTTWQAIHLRVQNNKIAALAHYTTGTQGAGPPRGIVLNEAADRLLVLTNEIQKIEYYPYSKSVTASTQYRSCSCRLNIYGVADSEADELLYTGRLQTGESLSADMNLIEPKKYGLMERIEHSVFFSMNNEKRCQALWPEVKQG